MCGGDDPSVQTEGSVQRLAEGAERRQNEAFGATMPFFRDRMENGFPYRSQFTDYAGGKTARAFGPVRARAARARAAAGDTIDDPAYMQTMTDIDVAQGRHFDKGLEDVLKLDEGTRQSAARSILSIAGSQDPLQAYLQLLQLQMQG